VRRMTRRGPRTENRPLGFTLAGMRRTAR
jgi:hypothetical protein